MAVEVYYAEEEHKVYVKYTKSGGRNSRNKSKHYNFEPTTLLMHPIMTNSIARAHFKKDEAFPDWMPVAFVNSGYKVVENENGFSFFLETGRATNYSCAPTMIGHINNWFGSTENDIALDYKGLLVENIDNVEKNLRNNADYFKSVELYFSVDKINPIYTALSFAHYSVKGFEQDPDDEFYERWERLIGNLIAEPVYTEIPESEIEDDEMPAVDVEPVEADVAFEMPTIDVEPVEADVAFEMPAIDVEPVEADIAFEMPTIDVEPVEADVDFEMPAIDVEPVEADVAFEMPAIDVEPVEADIASELPVIDVGNAHTKIIAEESISTSVLDDFLSVSYVDNEVKKKKVSKKSEAIEGQSFLF